jgi:hypothetical protein
MKSEHEEQSQLRLDVQHVPSLEVAIDHWLGALGN